MNAYLQLSNQFRVGLAVILSLGLAAASIADDGHNHEEKGPHGGAIVELGDESLHAELLHNDEDGTVTVYLLNTAVRRYVASEAAELVINVEHGDETLRFRLKAKPQKGDRTGRSSCYAITSAKLVGFLDDHDATAKMKIKVDGREYSGRIAHSHDHEHSHAH